MTLKLLHVGAGATPLPDFFGTVEETRLDIDPQVNPDVVASMLDMGDIGPFDAVYASHCLEHLYPHEVPKALSEFLRVLRPGGVAIIFVPNLEGVAPTDDVVYESAAGPISGLDMIYGPRRYTEVNPYMAHHTGFVPQTLTQEIEQAGFSRVEVKAQPVYQLFAAAVK